MIKIGIVGTGMLGEAVGLHLLNVGYEVNVYNRTKEKMNSLKEKGGNIMESPRQVGEHSRIQRRDGIRSDSSPSQQNRRCYGWANR